MQIVDDIKSVTYLKSRAADVLKQINETRRPMIITQNGEAKAVIQDPKSYEDMRNAIAILKLLSLAEEDIGEGKLHSEEDVFASVENLLNDIPFDSNPISGHMTLKYPPLSTIPKSIYDHHSL
jgi:prevent-host-death family protein